MSSEIKIGDWVNSYSQGVWQVQKIVQEYSMIYSPNETPTLKDDKVVLVKRLLNKSWKRSFSSESCSELFITPLSASDAMKLNDFISRNPSVYDAFLKYHGPLGSVLNLTFYVEDDRAAFMEEVDKIFSSVIEDGITNPQMIRLIESNNLNRWTHRSIRNTTLQFYCSEYETRDSHLVFRSFKVLDF